MSVLNEMQIRRRIEETDFDRKLLVTPLLTEGQIGPASVDIRLGSTIIVPKRTYVESQDVTQASIARQVESRRYSRIRLRYHSKFVLHPNELILAATFEYLSLPTDLCCTIASRSSWGRLGLIIATASVVQPGYKGCLTLELVNVSESPIVLYPGLLVGQLVFFDVEAPKQQKEGEKVTSTYQGRYICPTEADLPRFYTKEHLDDEMAFWGPSNKSSH